MEIKAGLKPAGMLLKNITVFLLLFVLTVLNLYNLVYAAESKKNLSSGLTYKFINENIDKYCFITSKTPSANAVYDYVSYDKNGDIESCGSQKGSFLISAGGSIVVTVTGKNAIDVTYNGAQIKVTEQQTPALYRITMKTEETVEIINKNTGVEYSVSAASLNDNIKVPKYDCVHKDIAGYVKEYENDAQSSVIQIIAGGAALVTAKTDLEIYLPYELSKNLNFKKESKTSLYTYTLSSGKTVAVTNSNLEQSFNISHDADISEQPLIFGYVAYDAYKIAREYGKSVDNIPVLEGGMTLITSESERNIKLWLPEESAADLKFNEYSEPALFNLTLAPEKTLRLYNNGKETYDIISSYDDGVSLPEVDFVYMSGSGAKDFGSTESGSILITPGDSLLITVNNGYPLKLWLPYKWKEFLEFSETTDAVLHTVTINPSESLMIVNKKKDLNLSFGINGGEYDYVIKNDGIVTEYGKEEASLNGFLLNGGGTALITADKKSALKVSFPESWLNGTLEIVNKTEPALYEYTLRAEKSITFEYTDSKSETERVIKTNSGERYTPPLDYVIRDSLGKVSDYAADGNFTEIGVERGGKTTVTAGKSYELKLQMPYEWIQNKTVAIKESASPAIFYKTVGAGQGIRIANTNKELEVNVSVKGEKIVYDYVYADKAGNILGCLIESEDYDFDISPESTYTLTASKDAGLTLFIPYEYTKNGVAFSGAKNSVYSYTLAAGQTVEISNADDNHAYGIYTGGVSKRENAKYDYVLINSGGDIDDYDAGVTGDITLSKRGKAIITAQKESIQIWFPIEWNNNKQISINKKSDPALYVHSIASGKIIDISNKSEDIFNIKNNSGSKQSDPKYDYILTFPGQWIPPSYEELKEATENNAPIPNRQWEAPLIELTNGNIEIPPKGNINIKASNGFEIKLWFPYQWLKHLTVK